MYYSFYKYNVKTFEIYKFQNIIYNVTDGNSLVVHLIVYYKYLKLLKLTE